MWATDEGDLAILDRPSSLRSHESFIKALKGGRAEAFELLFALYRGQIYNLAARMVRNPEDAKDLTQEIFLKAFQQIPRQNGDFHLEPWLYRVAVNTCLDHLRSSKRHAVVALADHEEQASATDTFEQAETGRLVEETLRQLSDRHRLALVLKDLHGLRHEEIAGILGISRGAAETLLFRAREAFRRVFETKAPAPGTRGGCAFARDVALQLAGRDVSPMRKRELVEHARVCPACRKTLKLQGEAVLGLGLFLGHVPLPSALRVAPSFAAPLSLGGGASATGGGATATAAATGLLGKITAAVGGKAAVVAIATGLTLATGTTAIQAITHGSRDNGRAAATVRPGAAARPDPANDSAALRAQALNGGQNGLAHGRGAGAGGQKAGGIAATSATNKARGKAVAGAKKVAVAGARAKALAKGADNGVKGDPVTAKNGQAPAGSKANADNAGQANQVAPDQHVEKSLKKAAVDDKAAPQQLLALSN